MAFSGTVSTTVFTTRKVIDRACGRVRLTPQQITSEIISTANDLLYLLLSNLANQGVPLWCIEKLIMPIYEGIGDIPLPTRIVDVLNSNLRYLQPVNGTNTDTLTSRTIDFGTQIFVSTVGVLWSAPAVPISIERSTDNIVWEVVQTETPSASAGEWTWYDLDSSVATQYFRVRATSGTLGFTTLYTGNSPTEITLARLNRDDYTNLPNKVFQNNRPLQYWFDRQIPQPVMHLWPVPNAGASTYQITAWCHRYIMDVGTMTEQLEVPERWYNYVVSGLADLLGQEIPEVPIELLPILANRAASDLSTAQAEERDNSPTYFAPNISMYTR